MDRVGLPSGYFNNTVQVRHNPYYYNLWLLKQIFDKLTFKDSGLWDYVRNLLRNMHFRKRNLEITETSRLSRDRHYLKYVMDKWYPHDRNLKPEMHHGPFREPFTLPICIYARQCTDGEGKIVPWTGFEGKGPPEWGGMIYR
jgi:hypothetical protein